jgi:hypothetical protein
MEIMTILSGVPPYELIKQIFMDEWETELVRDDFEWVMSLDLDDAENLPNDVQNRLIQIFNVTTFEDGAERYMEIIAFFGGDHDEVEVAYLDVLKYFLNRWKLPITENDFVRLMSLDVEN